MLESSLSAHAVPEHSCSLATLATGESCQSDDFAGLFLLQTVDDGSWPSLAHAPAEPTDASSSCPLLVFSLQAFDRDEQQEKQLLNRERRKSENHNK